MGQPFTWRNFGIGQAAYFAGTFQIPGFTVDAHLKDAQQTILFLVSAMYTSRTQHLSGRWAHYDSEASLPTANKGSGMYRRLPGPAAKQFG